jgi:hypothetical protein
MHYLNENPIVWDGVTPFDGSDRVTTEPPAVIPPPPPAAFEVSKLKLVRALRSIGLEPAFDAFLASDAIAATDWAVAQALLTDDPLLVAAMPALCQQANITSEQATAILESCRV